MDDTNLPAIGLRRRKFVWGTLKRPRKKPLPSALDLGRRPRGAPRQSTLRDEELIGLVDGWKAKRRSEGCGDISDRRTIAELLFEATASRAPENRLEIEARIAALEREAETKYAQNQALRRAVAEVEAERFEWCVRRLDRARRALRKRQSHPAPRF